MYHNWSINSGVPVAVVLTYGSSHAGLTLGLIAEAAGLVGIFLAVRLMRQHPRQFEA